VLLDDEQLLLDSLSLLIENKGKTVDKYSKPALFLEKLSQYDKDTKIFMDNDFKSSMNGIELAKKLHNKGYTNLYLFSGKDFMTGKVPNYVTIITKADIDELISFLD
jgi:FixJ family two-component response regulator